MIYTLKYPTHPLERVNQVVYEFLKNSIPDCAYSRDLFPEWFRDVMANSKAQAGNKSFEDKFVDLHTEYQILPITNRQSLFDEFEAGLDIKSLCEEKTKAVVLSKDYSENLHTALKAVLIDHFYGTALGTNRTIQQKLDTTLINHHIAFKNENNSGRVCPFCGLHEYALLEGEAKDDYDHWLYKSKYPIYAVNFSNLVPMCDKCNQSGVKGTADVLHNDDGTRRESFYPYEPNQGVRLTVNNYSDVDSLSDENKEKYPYGYYSLDIVQQDPIETEKVETWKTVFKIEKRFNSYLSSHNKQLKDDFHEYYLPDHAEFTLSNDIMNLRTIVGAFKNQLGNPKRKTGVVINQSYLDFICAAGNEHMLYTFCNINLAI